MWASTSTCTLRELQSWLIQIALQHKLILKFYWHTCVYTETYTWWICLLWFLWYIWSNYMFSYCENKNTCKHVIHNCTLHVQYIYNYMYMYTQSHTHVLYMHDTTACVHHIYTVHHTHVHVPSSFFSSGCFNCRNSLSILEKKQHNTHVLIYTVQCI